MQRHSRCTPHPCGAFLKNLSLKAPQTPVVRPKGGYRVSESGRIPFVETHGISSPAGGSTTGISGQTLNNQKQISNEKLADIYQAFYQNEPFVRILSNPPSTKAVSHTNFCDIYPCNAGSKIVIFSAIDNLIKGAAGQAIQNMNLICQMPETMGLL